MFANRYAIWTGPETEPFPEADVPTRTNDNGTKHSIDVTAAPDKLSMDADGKRSDLPKRAAPASLWGKDAIHQFDAFNPDTGKRLSMKVTDLGEEVLTRHGGKS